MEALKRLAETRPLTVNLPRSSIEAVSNER
jgi:hypothetical protein